MRKISNLASNRSVKIYTYSQRINTQIYKKKRLNDNNNNEAISYRTTTYPLALRLFKNDNQHDNLIQEMKTADFYNRVNKRLFLKPFRWTDLCEYCEIGKKMYRKINDYNKLHFPNIADLDSISILNMYMNSKVRHPDLNDMIQKINRISSKNSTSTEIYLQFNEKKRLLTW